MGKRGVTLEDKYLGPEPNYHGVIFKDAKEAMGAYSKASFWFNYFFNAKDNVPVVLTFAEKVLGYSKKDIQAIKKNPDWKINQGLGNNVRVYNCGLDFASLGNNTEKGNYLDRMKELLQNLLDDGKQIVQEKKAEPKKVVIPVQERTRQKVLETIYADFDEMVVDKWMDGEFDSIKFPAYSLLQFHKIKGAGINIFLEKIQYEYDLISDAYNKTCDQAIEAYSHIKKGNQRKMINLLEKIMADVQRLKQNNKVTRIPKAKMPKSSDAQVAKLNYLKEDIDAKLISINPTLIPRKNKLWVYNTKNRSLQMYVNDSAAGFEVRGSTVYNWDNKVSISTTLRKPQDIIPQILTKTEKQIDKVLSSLTTKINIPSGRINKDCILLRVL